jgi:DNA-binding winged helix-turn-helix (wHTH) protein/Tfp pilus assembly protein PilF
MSNFDNNPFRTAGPVARKLRFGTFEIDLQERELRNRGIRLKLQHKPFQILELLLERRGTLVTRAELAKRLWPDLHVSFDHGLNTAINTLRDTLGDSIRNPRYIETRSGLGYRFIAPIEEIWENPPAQFVAPANGESHRAKRYTPTFDAYQDYLRGRFFFSRRNEADLRKSVACFESAITQDPKYALAYTGLADVYNLFALLGALAPADAYRRVKELIARALQIDDRLPEAHASLADARRLFDWDYLAAEMGYLRALDLDTNYAEGHCRYAALLSQVGRFEQATKEVRRAMELDPLSLSISVDLAWSHYVAREFEAAMQQSWKTLVLEPTFAPAQNTLGLAYQHLGMHEEAITEFENARVCSGQHPAAIAALAHASAVAGKAPEAKETVRELENLSRTRHVSSYWKGIAYLGLGRVDAALHSIEKACEEHDPWLLWMKVEPRFDAVCSEPRFERVLAKLGFGSGAFANSS